MENERKISQTTLSNPNEKDIVSDPDLTDSGVVTGEFSSRDLDSGDLSCSYSSSEIKKKTVTDNLCKNSCSIQTPMSCSSSDSGYINSSSFLPSEDLSSKYDQSSVDVNGCVQKLSTIDISSCPPRLSWEKRCTPDFSSCPPRLSWEKCYTPNQDGNTFLHLAIVSGSLKELYQCVQLAPTSVCLDLYNDYCQTPLLLSVLTKQPQVTRHLVLCNANYRKCDTYARTPLHWAVEHDLLDCVKSLTDPISTQEIDMIAGERLHFQGRNVLKNETIDNVDSEGLTCAHIAAIRGNIQIMKQLMLAGANLNAKEWKSGMAPLHIAVEKNDTDMVQFLLCEEVKAKFSINLEAENFAGFTAYQVCYHDTVRSLLEKRGAVERLRADIINEMRLDSTDEEETDDEVHDKGFTDHYNKQMNPMAAS